MVLASVWDDAEITDCVVGSKNEIVFALFLILGVRLKRLVMKFFNFFTMKLGWGRSVVL